MSIELVRELAGVWSRPFVVDGDPFDVEVAIIGLNPATEIKVSEVSRETFHELLLKRRLFEDFYEKRRRAAGKASMSRTRQRLRLLVSGYGGRNITETNVNALPTRDEKQLRKHPHESEGKLIAEAYLKRIQPQLVIVHGPTVVEELRSSGILRHRNLIRSKGFVTDYGQACWNTQPCRFIAVPHLASRQKGWTDAAVAQISFSFSLD